MWQSAYPTDSDTSRFRSYIEHIRFISFKKRVSYNIIQEPKYEIVVKSLL